MKVFISWSGETSKLLAEIINKWLPKVIQSVETYFSPKDIEKGTKWESEITKNLNESEIGIICLTKSNLDSPWILFEAGALSNRLEKAKVCPILFGISNTDLTGPLSTFQTTAFTKDEFKKLIITINNQLGNQKVKETIIDDTFNIFYPELEKQINEVLKHQNNDIKKTIVRSERDILEEILELSRKQYYEPKPRMNPITRSLLTSRENLMRKEELIMEIVDLYLESKNTDIFNVDKNDLIEHLSNYEVIRSIANNKDEFISIIDRLLSKKST